MNELLGILKTYEVWIYVLLGLIGLIYIRKMISAILEWQGAVFGLEKEKAQKKISESTSVIILLLIVAAGWFLLISFVSPILPNAQALATPTLDLLATQTVTLGADLFNPTGGTLVAGGTPSPEAQTSGCIPGKLEFTAPEDASEVSGKLTLQGIINVTDFGFYKYEYSQPGSATWNTIAAGNQPILDGGDIGVWDTSQLNQGDYLLRLVVTDHQGSEQPPCVIQVRVVAP